jgi:pyruvate dehydrogenase phosphatase
VLDGHGGWQVSQFASKKLVPTVLSHLESGAGAAALGREQVAGRIIESFHALDQAYIESIRAAYERGFGEVAKVGSCVCLALVRGGAVGGAPAQRELVVANAGDCRAVLGTFNSECTARVSSSEGRAAVVDGSSTGAAGHGPKRLVGIQLTHDHNAREPHEQEVLCREHPAETLAQLVRCKSAAACYVKGRLQLTRSLGDLYLKSSEFNAPAGLHRSAGRHIPQPYSPPYVSGTPEITFCSLDERDK